MPGSQSCDGTELSLFSSLLAQHLKGISTLDEGQVNLLWGHYQLLVKWNSTINLTAIRNLDEAVRKHYFESIFLGTHLPKGPLHIADVGSGAGFPGIPVAVLRSDCHVTLIESNHRKAAFLREATRGWANAAVVPKRAETLDAAFDWLIARAAGWKGVLALIPSLAPSVALLLGPDDCYNALKTRHIQWEEPIPSPWGGDTLLVMGRSVSRGT